FGESVALGDGERPVVVGRFRGTADFSLGLGVNNLTSAGGDDVFIQKLFEDGTGHTTVGLGGAGNDRASDIAIDATSGTWFVTGRCEGTADSAPGAAVSTLTSAGAGDAFVARIDHANLLWAHRLGGAGADAGLGVVADDAGNAYVAGSFAGTADFDP